MAGYDKKIVLSDGSEYYGYSFGADRESVNEVVFHTAMAGYQELISDPSCTHLAVVMTYPLIGNYGIADDDFETKVPSIGGLIVKEYNDQPSNFRYTKTLSEILVENNIPAICGIDTRKLTRKIRDTGSQKIIITDFTTPKEEALRRLHAFELPQDGVKKVSCKKRWYSRTSNSILNVVAVDCGIKLSMIRNLSKRGCNVTVVPYNTDAEEIARLKPDGVLLSSGPGNPESVPETIELIKKIKGLYPIFGIGLGHQLIARAYGAQTVKMKVGHHGGNHPVMNIATGKIEITSQGHGFTVVPESLEKTGLTLTHINLLDKTVEGLENKAERIFSVQYHPESAPGPQDSAYLFDCFIDAMQGGRDNA